MTDVVGNPRTGMLHYVRCPASVPDMPNDHWDIISSSTVVAVVVATWLVWQLSELAVVVDAVVGVIRRQLAVRRVRVKWARFRSEHPEVF